MQKIPFEKIDMKPIIFTQDNVEDVFMTAEKAMETTNTQNALKYHPRVLKELEEIWNEIYYNIIFGKSECSVTFFDKPNDETIQFLRDKGYLVKVDYTYAMSSSNIRNARVQICWDKENYTF